MSPFKQVIKLSISALQLQLLHHTIIIIIVSILSDSADVLTVATRPVEAVHSSVLWFPVRKLQCGVQTPETFSQRVVFVVLDQLLDTHNKKTS